MGGGIHSRIFVSSSLLAEHLSITEECLTVLSLPASMCGGLHSILFVASSLLGEHLCIPEELSRLLICASIGGELNYVLCPAMICSTLASETLDWATT
jgi:hypothetical protein